jgi:hypothetical protein
MKTTRRALSSRIATVLLILFSSASTTLAAPRSPQVVVSGTALQSFFTSQGQTINVNTAQVDAQNFSLSLGASFQVLVFVGSGTSVGVYNGLAASPALFQILPGLITPGWTAFASFQPVDRLVVNLFDALNTSQGTTVYSGTDHTDFGFYAQVPGGLAYSQDARNAGGRAQMLAFSGTGSRAGSTWLAFEATPGPGGDFIDAVALVTLSIAPVPASPTRWSHVKSLFR